MAGVAFKNQGNQFFAKKEYAKAIELYSKAVEVEPSNHIYYSNRCAAYAGMGNFEAAKADGERCVATNPGFVKGYFRLASALKELGDFVNAEKTIKRGLQVQGDHPDLLRLRGEIEAEEKNARSSLSRPERLKAEGNEFFKASRFDEAIGKYTQALDSMSVAEESSPLALACLNNRAACNQQMSNFQAVVGDSTRALEIDPKNQKALIRRALAFEGLERYRSALADVRAVLAIDPTIEIANKAQHRLGANVRALKAAKKDGRK